jgi:hypothetical protein
MFGFEKEELQCFFFPFRCIIGENVQTQYPRRIDKKKTYYHILIGRIRIVEGVHASLAVSPRTSREIRRDLVRDLLTLRLPFVNHSLTFLTMTWERASISSDRASSIPRLMIPSLVATMYTSGLVPIASILFFIQHSSHPSTATRFSSSQSSSSSGRFRAVSWR